MDLVSRVKNILIDPVNEWRVIDGEPGDGGTLLKGYVAVLAAIGPVPLAVTINLNINFLRKPGRCDLTAEARLLKLGKRLATGEVTLRCEGEKEAVAHVTATYSIPPDQREPSMVT